MHTPHPKDTPKGASRVEQQVLMAAAFPIGTISGDFVSLTFPNLVSERQEKHALCNPQLQKRLLLILFCSCQDRKKLIVVKDKQAMLSCSMLSLLSLYQLFTKTSQLLPSVFQCYLHSDTNKHENMKIFFPAISYMPYDHH